MESSKRSIAGGMPDWNSEEERRIFEMYPSAEKDELLKALPKRTWDAICLRARKLGVKRDPRFKLCAHIIKDFKKPKLAPEALGYIASFLDAEGSIGINIEKGTWHLHPHVTMANQSKEALDFIGGKIGFGHVRGGGHDRMFKFSLEAYNAIIVFLEIVLPLLIIKKRQAQLMIEFCESRLRRLREGEVGYSEKEVLIAKALTKYSRWADRWKEFLSLRG